MRDFPENHFIINFNEYFSVAFPRHLDIKTCTDPTHKQHPNNLEQPTQQKWSLEAKRANLHQLVVVKISSCNHYDRSGAHDFGYRYFKSHQIDTWSDTKLMCSALKFAAQEYTLFDRTQTSVHDAIIKECACV